MIIESEEKSPSRPSNLIPYRTYYPGHSSLGGLVYLVKDAPFAKFMSQQNVSPLLNHQMQHNQEQIEIRGGQTLLAKNRKDEIRDEIAAKQNLLQKWKENLMLLEEQRAKYGIDAPLSLMNQLRDAKKEVRLLEDGIEQLERKLSQSGGA